MINIEKNLDPKLMTAKHKKKKSAFTLIELIVVIAIIAILAAALTPSFTGHINEAKKVAVINQAKNVVTAYEATKVKSSNTYTLNTTVDTFANGSDLLDEKDQLIANYRLKYPESSLQELSEIISIETPTKLTKSGIYHRLRKLKELSNKINE